MKLCLLLPTNHHEPNGYQPKLYINQPSTNQPTTVNQPFRCARCARRRAAQVHREVSLHQNAQATQEALHGDHGVGHLGCAVFRWSFSLGFSMFSYVIFSSKYKYG